MSIQSENKTKLVETLGNIDITTNEMQTIEWLSTYPVETIDNICSLIAKSKYRGGGRKPKLKVEDVRRLKGLGYTQQQVAYELETSITTVARYWHK